jgi:hypothetical protein
MWKRVLSAGMWLFVIAWAWNYAAWLFGVPEALGPIVGAAVALFVGTDPLHLFFAAPRRSTATASSALVPDLRGAK